MFRVSEIGSVLRLWSATQTTGPRTTIGLEDTHRGSLRLSSKQMVQFSQGFATCTKRIDSVGTYTPCNSTANCDPVVSEVEGVLWLVAVCVAVSVEMQAGVAAEDVSFFA